MVSSNNRLKVIKQFLDFEKIKSTLISSIEEFDVSQETKHSAIKTNDFGIIIVEIEKELSFLRSFQRRIEPLLKRKKEILHELGDSSYEQSFIVLQHISDALKQKFGANKSNFIRLLQDQKKAASRQSIEELERLLISENELSDQFSRAFTPLVDDTKIKQLSKEKKAPSHLTIILFSTLLVLSGCGKQIVSPESAEKPTVEFNIQNHAEILDEYKKFELSEFSPAHQTKFTQQYTQLIQLIASEYKPEGRNPAERVLHLRYFFDKHLPTVVGKKIQYNKETTSMYAVFDSGLLNCRSGTMLFLTTALEIDPTLVDKVLAIHTTGHVLPGIFMGQELVGFESTADTSKGKRGLVREMQNITHNSVLAVEEMYSIIHGKKPTFVSENKTGNIYNPVSDGGGNVTSGTLGGSGKTSKYTPPAAFGVANVASGSRDRSEFDQRVARENTSSSSSNSSASTISVENRRAVVDELILVCLTMKNQNYNFYWDMHTPKALRMIQEQIGVSTNYCRMYNEYAQSVFAEAGNYGLSVKRKQLGKEKLSASEQYEAVVFGLKEYKRRFL